MLRMKGNPVWKNSVLAKRISCWTQMNLWRKEPRSWVLLGCLGLKTAFWPAVMIRTAIWLWWNMDKIPKASACASSSTVCTNRRKSVALWGRRASTTTFWSLFLKITSSTRLQVRGNHVEILKRHCLFYSSAINELFLTSVFKDYIEQQVPGKKKTSRNLF